MIRRLIAVDGPLASRMMRFQAAQANEVGFEALTLPLLAYRLAGGFRCTIPRMIIKPSLEKTEQWRVVTTATGGSRRCQPRSKDIPASRSSPCTSRGYLTNDIAGPTPKLSPQKS